jgi:hypothetical protein
MGKEEDVIEVRRDVERDFQQDEKPDFSGGAEEVVGMQDLDPALDKKMHLVNNVSWITREDVSSSKLTREGIGSDRLDKLPSETLLPQWLRVSYTTLTLLQCNS